MNTILRIALIAILFPGTQNASFGAPTPVSVVKPKPPVNRAPIVIGEFGVLTGHRASIGLSTDLGIKFAVDSLNSQGGINGRKLTVKLRDDKGDPATAVEVVKKLIAHDKVSAILGEVESARSIVAAPVCNDAGVPMISPSSTNPVLTRIGPFIFRACMIDPVQGKAAAIFAVQHLKAKRAAIITDTGQIYSMGVTQAFADTFVRLGGRVVCQESYTTNGKGFQRQLQHIQGAKPDIIYIPGYYADAAGIARQARAMGLKTTLLGGDGWESPRLINLSGGPGTAIEGAYFTDHYSTERARTESHRFLDAFTKKYGHPPDSLAVMGYDAVGLLANALKRAGAPADGDYASRGYRAKLRHAIASTKGYLGVTGPITMGSDRNPIKPAVIMQVHGSEFKYVTVVNP